MDINEYIKQMVREMLDEESTSGDAGAYLTPKAFAKKGQGKNVATKTAEKQGMKVAPEGMPSDSKVKDYKAIWGKKKKYKIYKESDYDKASPSSNPSEYSKASPSSNPSLYLQKSPYTSENMKESSQVNLNKQHQDKISNLSPEQKKALYNDLTDAVADVNDMDFSGPTAKADYAKAMKNAKTKVFQKHNIIKESLSYIIEQELINEATYSKFKKDISYRSKTEMLHKGIKEVKRKLAEIDRIVEYTSRMKQELSEGEEGIKYWKATVNNVTQISEMVNTLNEKIKNLYQ